jgi:hypothetical protein
MPRSLPVELLAHIVELSTPSSSDKPSVALKCRKSLQTLCILSKGFHDLAQPVLWRTVRNKQGSFVDFSIFRPDLAKSIRTIEYEFAEFKEGHGEALETIRCLPNLNEVRILETGIDPRSMRFPEDAYLAIRHYHAMTSDSKCSSP